MSTPQVIRSVPMDLGSGYQIEFTYSEGRIGCEWSPDIPDDAADRAAVMAPNRKARDLFLSGVSRSLGISIAVVELGGNPS